MREKASHTRMVHLFILLCLDRDTDRVSHKKTDGLMKGRNLACLFAWKDTKTCKITKFEWNRWMKMEWEHAAAVFFYTPFICIFFFIYKWERLFIIKSCWRMSSSRTQCSLSCTMTVCLLPPPPYATPRLFLALFLLTHFLSQSRALRK